MKPIAFHVTIQAGYLDRFLAIANTQLADRLALVQPSTTGASPQPLHPAGFAVYLIRKFGNGFAQGI
ncbi:hypothetical protein [Microcoleus anatoxicus]|uniref:Uncharacterized protein n=1 Tax=Microcoleus anatoxicus PTRS2 TaxID=2705321 RepID=A0ABU8YL95_9CYAN